MNVVALIQQNQDKHIKAMQPKKLSNPRGTTLKMKTDNHHTVKSAQSPKPQFYQTDDIFKMFG